MNLAWYRVAVGHPDAPPSLVVAPGEHLGAAIAAATSRHKGAWPIAVAAAAPDEVPLGESVRKGIVVEKDAPTELPADLRWPTGIVPSLTVPGHKLAAMAPGWTRHPDDALLVIEAQVMVELGELFLGLVERLPVADNLEVRILDHHDGGGGEEVWLTPRLDVKRAIRFLDDHDVELVDNGHVEVSLYLRKERSTLRLTEHKTVVWLSEDLATADRVAEWLAELEVPRVDALTTIADTAHFHYRPVRSSARDRMITRLGSMKLRRVDGAAAG